MDELRLMSVRCDGEPVAQGLNMRLKGRSTMCLRPDIWILDIYEADGYSLHQLRNASLIQVLGENDSELCRGSIADVYRYMEGASSITSVLISDGGDFWGSSVSFALAAGNTVEKTIRTLLGYSSVPVKLGTYRASDATLTRGQVFHGKTVQYISDLAKSVSARAYFARGALSISGRGKGATVIKLTPDGGLDDVSRADGALVAVMGTIRGYAVGQLVSIPDDAKQYRLICQSIDANNYEGTWKTELIMIDESKVTDDDWSGGI